MATIGHIKVLMSADTGGLRKGVGQARGQLRGFTGNITAGTGSMLKFAAGAATAVAGLAAMKAGLTGAVRVATEFDDSMNLASRTMGIGLGPEMDKVSEGIKELATDSKLAGITIGDLGEIAVMGGRMGEGSDSILDFTRSISMVKLSLDDIPVEESVQGLSQLNKSFDLGSDKILNTASALNILSNNAKTTGRDILDTAGRLKQNASLLKLSVTETLALSTSLLDAGVSAEVAGTNMGLFLAKMATDVEGFAKTAGMAAGEFETILDSNPMEALSLFLGGLSESRHDIALLEELGITGARESGVVISLRKAGEGLHEFARMAEEDFKSQQSLMLDVETSTQKFSSQVQYMWNRLSVVGIQFGNQVMPIITSAFDGLVGLAEGTNFGPITSGLSLVGNAVSGAISLFKDLQTGITETFSRADQTLKDWGFNVGETTGMVGDFFGGLFDGLGFTLRNLPDLFEIMVLQATEKLMQLGDWIGVIPANLAQVGEYVAGNWKELITDGVNGVLTVFENLGQNLWDLGRAIMDWIKNPTGGFNFEMTPLLDGFEATAEQLPDIIRPALTDMSGDIGAVMDRIAANELARTAVEAKSAAEEVAEVHEESAAKIAQAAGKAGEAGEFKAAGALELGSSEARSAILRGANRPDDAMSKVAKTSQDQLVEQREQTTLLRRIAAGDSADLESFPLGA